MLAEKTQDHGVTLIFVREVSIPGSDSAVVRNAEGGRYAEAALKEPVPMHKSVVLNGDAFDYETYPRRVQRR